MKKGFTLIEMLIVVVIVGTLMAVAVPKYHIALETGRSREGIVYIKALADDLNAYYWMWGHYPLTSAGMQDLGETVYWNNLSDRGLPKLNHFFMQIPAKGCTSNTCNIGIERNGGDMYSLEIHLTNGEIDNMLCSACLQTGPNTLSCNGARESYNRYCSVIGKESVAANGATIYPIL